MDQSPHKSNEKPLQLKLVKSWNEFEIKDKLSFYEKLRFLLRNKHGLIVKGFQI